MVTGKGDQLGALTNASERIFPPLISSRIDQPGGYKSQLLGQANIHKFLDLVKVAELS